MTKPKPDIAERVARKLVVVKFLPARRRKDEEWHIFVCGQFWDCFSYRSIAKEHRADWIVNVARRLRRAGVRGK